MNKIYGVSLIVKSKGYMLICWNLNSVSARLEHLKKVIKQNSPDVLLLQEIKCINEKFPHDELGDLGYNIEVFGQKTYNGVAVLSKHPIEDVCIGLEQVVQEQEARYIETTVAINGICNRIISVYVPNGAEVGSEKFKYKLEFLQRLYERLSHLKSIEENIIIGGDFNIAPEEIDVYDAKQMSGRVCFHIDERKWFRKILNLGYIDSFREFNRDMQQFSWWDYRAGSWQHNKGLRIDQILISPKLMDKITKAGVLTEPRGWERTSDHAPIYIGW
ncbi:exodeoxyribonuclease III [Candidatus Bandiella euplotis]|nr:exodeoxyribonuclease III [Candidatus Bandiella woodruffii]